MSLLAEVWELLAGTPRFGAPVALVGPTDVLPATLPVSELAAASVAASLVAASDLSARRNNRAALRVTLDTLHVATAFHSEAHARVNGQHVGGGFAPLSRFWPTADGWIRTHANYPWHEARLLSVLGVEPDPVLVAAAIARRDAPELEASIFAADGCAAMVRTPEEWLAHLQGNVVSRLPLVEVERVGDAAPRVRAPAREALEGVRVLDLTRVIAGPVCTRTLAAHGADVLRVDNPLLPELDQQWVEANPGKRSTFVDFATDDGRATLDRLLADVDVIVVGYRGGALDRFGLASDDLARCHPGVVLVTLSAWGDRGPWAARRGFDSLVQAASGIARLQARGADEPGALPAQALDHATGYLAAAAAMAGIVRQMSDGGTWHARLSLAQTAAYLLRAPRSKGAISVSTWDPTQYVVDLPRAADVVSVVAPPGMLGGERLTWPSAPPEPGADAPEWRRSA